MIIRPTQRQRRAITTARLEGILLGMLVTIVLIWLSVPIVTGDWSLL